MWVGSRTVARLGKVLTSGQPGRARPGADTASWQGSRGAGTEDVTSEREAQLLAPIMNTPDSSALLSLAVHSVV